MPDYYVLVSKLGTSKVVVPLCGHLYARSSKKAQDEAGPYIKQLNGGWPIDVMGDEWLVGSVCTESMARNVTYFRKFKKQRVTPDPNSTIQPQNQSRKKQK